MNHTTTKRHLCHAIVRYPNAKDGTTSRRIVKLFAGEYVGLIMIEEIHATAKVAQERMAYLDRITTVTRKEN